MTYRINVGGTDIDIPEALIDTEDFARVVFRVAGQSIHNGDKPTEIKLNWKAGDLNRIGKELKHYDAILAIAKGKKCRKLGSLGLRLAELYVREDLWIETEFDFQMQSALLEAHASILRRTEEEIAEDNARWDNLVKELENEN